jgi:cobalt ECF transporter T component CbiQ
MSKTRGFEDTLVELTRMLGQALVNERVARQNGLLQRVDPRVKAVGLPALVVAATLAHKFGATFFVFAIALILAVASRVSVGTLLRRVWLPVALFTGAIALPALVLTPGSTVGSLPMGLHISGQGLRSASLLMLRVETAATLMTLLVLTTPWMQLLHALRWFRIPQEVVMMLAMTHRYVFLLGETAAQMFESRQSRTVGVLDRTARRQVTSRTAGVLLSKSIELSNEVFQAMQSRGFRGDARVLIQAEMRMVDYFCLAAFLALAALCAWVGR